MTFDSNMQVVQQEAIPELYAISAGGYVWRYTSYKTDLTFLGNLYRAAAIVRSGFTVDRNMGSAQVTVSIPLSEPLQYYVAATPLPSTKIQIYRAVVSALTDFALLFEGMIRQVSIANKVVSAECSPAAKLKAKLPHIVYQSYCNWQVFDCNCGLDAAVWGRPISIAAISGADVTSTSFGNESNGYWTQGRIYFDGDYRFITNHVGNVVTLQVPFFNLAAGQSAIIYPGCDGSPAICRSKFNNWSRHLSMPYIPSHNPVIWSFK